MSVTKTFYEARFNLNCKKAHWNLSPELLTEAAIKQGQGLLSDKGALCIRTGEFTGRSPKDKFIVKDSTTETTVDWNDINQPISSAHFDRLLQKMLAFAEPRELYIQDVYACADERYKLNVRVIAQFPWSCQFAHNMFKNPTTDELAHFNPEWTILCLPEFMANQSIDGTRQHNYTIVNFTKKIVIIGGSGYTGEIKKSIFSVLNYTLPLQENVLSMHCSANVGQDGDTAIFFGLSGTGKTTLSTDAERQLIGDDEHGWSEEGVFNFEGGSYAKVIDLSKEKEPEIYNAIRPGALLENVILNDKGEVDFQDTTITQNTRVSYPIHHIENIKVPSTSSNVTNIFFLTADAFGVLPPISKLTPEQAAYHFVNGYTAKVAGTEAGVNEPTPSFSACFGAPFMPLHPQVYGDMLIEKMKQTNANVWLVNTGWTGGAYGTGSRIKLRYTRAMINAALEGKLNEVAYKKDAFFDLQVPEQCPNVPSELLDPRQTWEDKEAYDQKAQSLLASFEENYKKFE